MRKLFIIFFLFTGFSSVRAQCPLSSLGQNPSTAFPVCGTTVFHQQTVPLCFDPGIEVPGCGTAAYGKNPYWYKFTCYQSGTLGFLITPILITDDYDWQLYDVTGHDADYIYSNPGSIVTGNWSGTTGLTGAMGNTPTSLIRDYHTLQCASFPTDNEPKFQTMPPLTIGHNYLLVVSHYDDSQSGYDLSFGGGTAVITDPVEPHLVSASAPCDGTEIRVKLNKHMVCRSLQANGSDFIVNTPSGIVHASSAFSKQCTSGFDFDSLSVFLSAPLVPGVYSLGVVNGTDGNTLLDYCDRAVPLNETVSFTVYPIFPTPFDSITKVKCSPKEIELVFRKRMKCSTIDADGSDFTITGPAPVTVSSAHGECDDDGYAYKIYLQLSAPIQLGGIYQISLHPGNDGTTIIDECAQETPPSQLSFSVSDTVNASFSSGNILYACDKDIVHYHHNGANGVNMWHWSFGTVAPDVFTQNPVITYTNFEDALTTLIVSNGVCHDTVTTRVVFDNYLKADFTVSPLLCPEDKAIFKNLTVPADRITDWLWLPGNGNIITVKDPVPQTYVPLITSDYTAMPQLIVKNDYGCYDTISKPIEIIFSCFIDVPTAFTPNGDGLNDYLYPLKAYKSSKLVFSIFNRFGQRVFYTDNWQQKWDGTFKGNEQPPGTYVWMLSYTNTDTGKPVFKKGTSILIR